MHRVLVVVLMVLGMLVPAAQVRAQGETAGERDARMEWWRGARFGMFIHWGLYCQLAGEYKGEPVAGLGEWIMHDGKIPLEEYEKLTTTFNPSKFDAREWVRIAKGAGMKYIVITTKHHDGFCLFDSGLTDYDIMSTPFQRDIMKELAEACREEGLRICWYHSIMDWHHPDYLPRRAWDTRPTTEAYFDRYRGYMKAQVDELLTKYGPIGVMWFDGEWEETWDHASGVDLYDHCRSIQPDLIVNNRVDKGRQGMAGLTKEGGFRGDFGTPEQEILGRGLPGVDWETCQTMNETWGFKKDDDSWKTGRTLIRQLIETASKGGNFLLNVGPTEEGLIPEPSVKRLREMGEWMKVNGESIYGTGASPFANLPWGRCTSAPGKLYLHVFDWPGEKGLRVPGLRNRVMRAYVLTEPAKALEMKRESGDLMVMVPGRRPDRNASVVVLEIEGETSVDNSRAFDVVTPGTITLEAKDAVLTKGVELERVEGWEYLGLWRGKEGTATWTVKAPPGAYRIEIEFGCAPGSEGNKFVLMCAGKSINGMVPPTREWRDFEWLFAGRVEIGAGQGHTLTIAPSGNVRGALMNVRSVRLLPE